MRTFWVWYLAGLSGLSKMIAEYASDIETPQLTEQQQNDFNKDIETLKSSLALGKHKNTR